MNIDHIVILPTNSSKSGTAQEILNSTLKLCSQQREKKTLLILTQFSIVMELATFHDPNNGQPCSKRRVKGQEKKKPQKTM